MITINFVSVIFVSSSINEQNLVTFASSSGASTSSRIQIGAGLIKNTANINLEYKLGTLKLPKLIKRYRNGKVTEQFSTFEIADLDDGPRVFLMTPRWDNDTPELDAWRLALQQEAIPVNDWGELNYLDELP